MLDPVDYAINGKVILRNGVTLQGVTTGSTRLVASSTYTGSLVVAEDGSSNPVQIEDIALRDLSLIGAGSLTSAKSGSSPLLALYWGSGWLLERCAFTSSLGPGAKLGDTGTYKPLVSRPAPSNISITDCQFTANGLPGYHTDSSVKLPGLEVEAAQQRSVLHCAADGNGAQGFLLRETDMSATASTASQNAQQGFLIDANLEPLSDTEGNLSPAIPSSGSVSTVTVTASSVSNPPFPPTAYIWIDSELFSYSAYTVSGGTGTFGSVTRARGGTTMAAHAVSAQVIAAQPFTFLPYPSSVGSGDSTIPVVSVAELPSAGFIQIGTEAIQYGSLSVPLGGTPSLQNCIRARFGGAAGSYSPVGPNTVPVFLLSNVLDTYCTLVGCSAEYNGTHGFSIAATGADASAGDLNVSASLSRVALIGCNARSNSGSGVATPGGSALDPIWLTVAGSEMCGNAGMGVYAEQISSVTLNGVRWRLNGKDGVRIDAISGATPMTASLTGCDLRDNGQYGLHSSVASPSIVVHGNTFAFNKSGATSFASGTVVLPSSLSAENIFL